MLVNNYGSPLDKKFEVLVDGESFIFHGMAFMKVNPVKLYRKDIPDLPDDAELPNGKDYLDRNAVNLGDGMLWTFENEDIVETPRMEVCIGVKPPMPEDMAGKLLEQQVEGSVGNSLNPSNKINNVENPGVILSPEAAQDFMNKPIEKGE